MRLEAARLFGFQHAASLIQTGVRPERAMPAPPATIGGRPTSLGFIAMLNAYRASGGAVSGDALGQLLQDHQRGDHVGLAKLIALGHVFAFEWRGRFWIPMFQLDGRDLSCKPGPSQVRAELPASLSGWAVAAWFAEPNALLEGQRPVDLMDSNSPAVLDAARHSVYADTPAPNVAVVPGREPRRD